MPGREDWVEAVFLTCFLWTLAWVLDALSQYQWKLWEHFEENEGPQAVEGRKDFVPVRSDSGAQPRSDGSAGTQWQRPELGAGVKLMRSASRGRKAFTFLHLPLDLLFHISQIQGNWMTVQASLEIWGSILPAQYPFLLSMVTVSRFS